MGEGTWVGKPAYLAADPLTIQEGWWEIAQAMTRMPWIKVRGPCASTCESMSTPQPFRFYQWGDSPQRDIPGDAN